MQKIKEIRQKLDHNAADLYLFLLTNQNKTVYNLFIKTPTDKHNKEIYLQGKKLFSLREDIVKNLFNKRIIKNTFSQSDIEKQKPKESTAEKTESESAPRFKKYISGKTKLNRKKTK